MVIGIEPGCVAVDAWGSLRWFCMIQNGTAQHSHIAACSPFSGFSDFPAFIVEDGYFIGSGIGSTAGDTRVAGAILHVSSVIITVLEECQEGEGGEGEGPTLIMLGGLRPN